MPHADSFEKKSFIRWMWFSVVFFGGGAIFVPDWSDPSYQAGGIVGLVTVIALIVLVAARWNVTLTQKELEKSHAAAAKYSGWSSGLLALAGIGYFIVALVRGTTFEEQLLGFSFVLMGLGSVLALVIAYSNKGLFQGMQ